MSNSWIPVALTALVCACVLSEMNANPVAIEEIVKNGEKTSSCGCGGNIEKTDGGKECNSSYDKKGQNGNDNNDEKVCDNKGKDDQLCENANGVKNSNQGNSDKEYNSDYDNKGGGNDGIKEKNCWKYPRSNGDNITKSSDTNYDNNSQQKCVTGNNTKDINGRTDSNCNKGDDISNNGHPCDHREHTRNRHVKECKNIIKEKQKCSNLCKDNVDGNKHNRGTKIASCNKCKIVTQKTKVIEIAKVKTKLSKSAHTSKPKPFNEGNCSTREEYKNGNDLKGSCSTNEDNGGKDAKKDNFRNCENKDDNQCIEKKEQKCDNSSNRNPEHNPGNTSSDGKDDNCSKNANDQKECVKEIGVKCKKADNIEIKEKYKHCDNSNGGIHDTVCGKDNVNANKRNHGTKIASCNKCKIVTEKTKVIEIAKVKTKLTKSCALKRKTLKGKRANGDEVVDNSSVLNDGCCNKDEDKTSRQDEDQSNDGNREQKCTDSTDGKVEKKHGIIVGDCKEGNGSKIDEGGKGGDK